VAKGLHNLLVNRIMDRAIERHAARHLRGDLIDIGCGTKPYAPLLAPYVRRHVGLDRQQPFNEAARADLIGTAYDIPTADGSFDSALSTATLEHLAEPGRALRETNRVLKPGGLALYTVPLIWHVHAAPWDYYRFTSFGLKHVFEDAGFEIVELEALSGFWVTVGQLFVYYLLRFRRGPATTRLILAVGLAVQALAYALDRLDKAEDWTWMYLVVARKKELPRAKAA
jgi:SAM-dependent methyltransferase